MPVIVDSSFIYALFNHGETGHLDAVSFALANADELLLPDVVLPEASYLFRRDFSIFRPQHCDFFELLPAA